MTSELDTLLLGTQVALSDSIHPFLRCVQVNIDSSSSTQQFFFYYDGEITDELFDLASVACTEGSCYLPYLCEDEILRLDYPKSIPRVGTYAYLRYEPNIKLSYKTREFENTTPVAMLLLYAQQALLGRVLPNLREVTLAIDAHNIKLIFIYDGEITFLARNLAEQAIEEVAAIYKKHKICPQIERVDFPEAITLRGERTAFARYEKRLSAND